MPSTSSSLIKDQDAPPQEEDTDPFWPRLGADLAAIRRLLEADESDTCPCCGMPFDKGKKRKLIDSCGHERCYSCIFASQLCPLCPPQGVVEKDSMASSLSWSKDSRLNRTRVKTDEPFTSSIQNGGSSREMSPCRLPRPGKAIENTVMTQSCPTPPQGRKKFFQSSKSGKNPFGMLISGGRPPSDSALSGFLGGPLSMSQPTEGETSNRRWSSVIIGKIKSLWSSSSSSAGLNLLVSDDEGGSVKPSAKKCIKKKSQQDLYTRLGLLLGDGARRTSRRPLSHDSVSSLASLEAHTLASTNTSPVSTLTGSSEVDASGRVKDVTGSDSVGSLMSVSGHSNASSSPLQRRHSLTSSHPGRIDRFSHFADRRQSVRRSARSASIKGPIDPKVRFAEYRTRGLPLRPLFFEVPRTEPHPLFIGRERVIKEIEDWTCRAGEYGVLITGHPGTGKSALLLELVQRSCFASTHSSSSRKESSTCNGKDRPNQHAGLYGRMDGNSLSDRINRLASNTVAYHFCQADNSITCHIADFIHSVAAQLCQAPQLSAYNQYLLNEPHILSLLSVKECIADSEGAWVRGVLEPLCLVGRGTSTTSGSNSPSSPLLILVDGLCEAEYHRPDSGHTLASFLAAHAHHAPPWLKFVLTVRTHMDELLPPMPFHYISLDVSSSHSESLQKDLLDYINLRVTSSQNIQSNIISGAAGQFRLCQAVAGLARGSMLFAKLTLDLMEAGHLVAKSASYKVLPVSLSQIFLLHFNLRFPTAQSFEKVSPILSVCLSALMPLTLLEIYYSINALNTYDFVYWEDFLHRFKMLNSFLVKRLDNTYMFFHPSFREWLLRRDEGESTKFLCDLRTGSLGIAMRLSRLEAPLQAEKTLELGHHILKAHLYKNMSLHRTPSRDLQALWICSSSYSVSKALASIRNVYNPNVKVSRLLLLSGADPNVITDLLGSAPLLCLAAFRGLTDMVSLLLEFGADPSLANSQGSTPLTLAASNGHSQCISLLISSGAPLGRTDTSGRCALVHAARSGHFEVVSYLVSCDWSGGEDISEDVELSDAVKQALVAASAQSHLQIVEYLLDLSEVGKDEVDALTGETALTVAASSGSTSTLTALITRAVSLTTCNRKGESALQLAVKEGHWGCVERLVQSGAPLEQADPQGRAPLALAASYGHVALIELLLDKGADLERQDNEGITALGWACLKGRCLAVQRLLDKGANVNQTTHSGRTPLDLAAEQPDPTIVQVLLERGGMMEHVDIQGMRPLDRAVSYRNIPVVQSLLKRGAKLGPTTWAMAHGKTDVLLVLLNKLLEDGNVLYRKARLEEAAHRYKYALAKFPSQEESSTIDSAFRQLKLNFLLNYSRCKRKMNEPAEAVELATQVINEKPDCYEAFYARAKARVDLKEFDNALKDVQEALILLQPQNKEVRRVLLNLRDEIRAGQRQRSTSTDTVYKSFSLTTDL